MVSDLCILAILSLPCLVTSEKKKRKKRFVHAELIVLCGLIGPQRQSSGVITADNYISWETLIEISASIYNFTCKIEKLL